MIARIFTLALLFTLSLNALAQKRDTAFQREWLAIDTLILQRDLTRTALKQVEAIYVAAKQKQFPEQVVKSLLYRISLEKRVVDNDPDRTIRLLKKEISSSTDPVQRAVLHSVLARQYHQYYNEHRWQIYRRSNTLTVKADSIATWSSSDFGTVITRNYLLSIAPATILQQKKIELYNPVVIEGNARLRRPTLYDLLAHAALDYFKSAESMSDKPVEAFVINQPAALGTIREFIQAQFPTKDSSGNWQTLMLFKKLMAFHANDADKTALLNVNMERMEWVRQSADLPNEETLYRRALEEITTQYATNPLAAGAWLALARLENEKADHYTPFGDTSNRFARVQAKQIIDHALMTYRQDLPETAALKQLLAEIQRRELHTQTERVNIPEKPFRALVSYRNLTQLHGKIIRLEEKDDVYDRRWEGKFWKEVLRKPVYKNFTLSLPDTKDYQQHSTEIKIDALPVGRYLLVTSEGPSFADSTDKMSAQLFHVSNISYVQNGLDFFVLARDNGQPLAGATVSIYENNKPVATRTSDKNGFFRYKDRNQYVKIGLRFAHKKDILDLSSQQMYSYDYSTEDEGENDENKNTYENENQNIFYFTDRSIYRPGQTVYFKGIAIAIKQKTRLSKIITGRTDWVYLLNVNGEKIDSLRFTLNDYGSFSGSFQLPQQVLTGNFALRVNNYGSMNESFNVEEYKRPTFSVAFDKVKGSYRLGDSITVTGTATTYSGAPVTGAKLVYNVNRSTRFRDPWYRGKSILPMGSREIGHGEISTDGQGKFTIRFKALADDVLDKTARPVFSFSVSADVTDISGETRSTQTSINAGFSAVQLTLSVPAMNEADSLKEIRVSATNMNDQPEPSRVRIRIYELQSPAYPVRKRFWTRPDQYVMSREQFSAYFPTDEYGEETDYRNWPVKTLVKEETLDTQNNSAWSIQNSPLPPGFYRIEATTTDRYGEEARTQTYTQLFTLKSGSVASPLPFNYTVLSTVEPGQQATFITNVMGDAVYYIRRIDREQNKKGRYEFVERKKGYETITYTPEEKDRGGIMITEAFVYDNRVYSNTYPINVPWTNKMLQVQYETFRDKTEPGSKEKWTISVKNDKKGNVAAELLTGMYDASLDQFNPHSWNSPSIWPTRYWLNRFNGSSNFAGEPSINNTLREKSYGNLFLTYDRLASDAYELARVGILQRIDTLASHLPKEDRQRLQLRLLQVSGSMPEVMLQGKLAGISVNNASLDEVVVVGYGAPAKKALSAPVAIRGKATGNDATALYVVDGVVTDAALAPSATSEEVESVTALSGAEATALYGSKAANGAIVITTKKGAAPKPTVIRKNFQETAFFFPQLHADSTGTYSFSFTMPESLTQWKWMSLAHTRDLAFGTQTGTIVTQKKLMTQANAPRFLREGDNMEFSGKIINMSEQEITGQASLELIDPVTNTSVDGWFQNVFPVQYFTVEPGQSFALKFPIQIPFSYNHPVTWRLKAVSGNMSDGEENTLPVLTNRMLVTESLPLFLPNDTTLHFSFDKLLKQKSESLTHESITVEYSSNPVWNAVQALPYLMEYPYECAEQTFNRLYANALGSYILGKHPRIKQVLDQWLKDSVAMKSNLQKNEELKQILLQETPWVLNAANEAEQKKNLGLLFDLARLSTQTETTFTKLQQAQLEDGSFSWFRGGRSDRYITQYILTGIGKLKRLGALSPDMAIRIRPMLLAALKYTDARIAEDYNNLVKFKSDLTKPHIGATQIDYLYMRSFFRDIAIQSPKAYDYYCKQGHDFWIQQSSYYQAELGLVFLRNQEEKLASGTILPALLENTVIDSKQGMYWKNQYAGFWYRSPIEHQSMMIAFVSELNLNHPNASYTRNLNAMKTWLLLNKQTNNWRTTIATADACYALLLNGSDWLSQEKKVTIQLGQTIINSESEKTTAGTGYFKKRIDGKSVTASMGDITVSMTPKTVTPNYDRGGSSPGWGSIYWQYFEDLDKITPAATPLSLAKKLFIQRNTDKGVVLDPVKENQELNTGDKIIVRIELRSDRDMDYVHLKDMRAAAMEPVNVLSGYRWQDGIGYYESTKDAGTHFLIDHLRKGTYVFEYPLFITHTGLFSVGIASIQCMYAPEFTSHSEGIRIRVAK